MTIANVEGTIYNVCDQHQVLYLPDQVCSRCAAHERDMLSILEARIADHDSEIAGLRRQVIELRHSVLDLQRAHNVLAAHTRPNVDLLP